MPTPAYIPALRETWGHRPLLLPGVSGVVVDGPAGAERVLLVRRTDTGLLERAGRDRRAGRATGGLHRPGAVGGDPDPRPARATQPAEHRSGDHLSQRRPLPVHLDDVPLPLRLRGSPTVGDEESTEVGWFAVDDLPDDLSERARRRISSALPCDGPCLFESRRS